MKIALTDVSERKRGRTQERTGQISISSYERGRWNDTVSIKDISDVYLLASMYCTSTQRKRNREMKKRHPTQEEMEILCFQEEGNVIAYVSVVFFFFLSSLLLFSKRRHLLGWRRNISRTIY